MKEKSDVSRERRKDMARIKTITREQILKAAYDVVATDGFDKFTARNVAAKMKCSTQPIYLEFKNMDELRSVLFEQIKEHLLESTFACEHIGDPVIDLVINYIEFAAQQPTLYNSLFVQAHQQQELINEFSYSLFVEKLEESQQYQALSETDQQVLFSSTWVVATGFASLSISGHLHPTKEHIIQLLTHLTDSILNINSETSKANLPNVCCAE